MRLTRFKSPKASRHQKVFTSNGAASRHFARCKNPVKNEVTLQELTEGLTDLKKPVDICRVRVKRNLIWYMREVNERDGVRLDTAQR